MTKPPNGAVPLDSFDIPKLKTVNKPNDLPLLPLLESTMGRVEMQKKYAELPRLADLADQLSDHLAPPRARRMNLVIASARREEVGLVAIPSRNK